MTIWTIQSGTGSGTALVGCIIVATHTAGITNYKFLRVGATAGPTTVISPPEFIGVHYLGYKWRIYSGMTPPKDPPKGTLWKGTCDTEDGANDSGTWQAEATGGTGFSEKGTKGTKSAKKTRGRG